MLTITNDNSTLAQIWLAANMTTLGRAPVLQTRIAESAEEIAAVTDASAATTAGSGDYVTLRTSGELLQGIVRVYAKQAGFLLADLKDTLAKINVLFKASARVTVAVSSRHTFARMQNIVLEDTVTEKEVLLMPALDFLSDSHGPGAPNRVAGATAIAQSAAMYDTSLELGRQFPGSASFLGSNDGSLLDLHLDEGTRAGGSSTLANPDLPLANDDFPLPDDQFSSEWNMDLGQDQDNDGTDESLEVGRRADGSVLEEHTDFGFDLDIPEKDALGEDSAMQSTADAPVTTMLNSLRHRRRRNVDPALLLTEDIIVDMDLVLSRPEMDHISTNATEGVQRASAALPTRCSRKRLLRELEDDTAYVRGEPLLSYSSIKRQRLEASVDVPPLDMDLQLANDDSIDNFDLIGDMDAPEDTAQDIHQDMDFDIDIAPEEPQQDLQLQPQLSDLTDASDATADNQVRLTTGEAVAQEVVHLAQTLRELTAPTTTFTELLQSTDPAEAPTRTRASRCFFDMLTLASAGCVALSQPKPYATIAVAAQPALAHKYIPA